MQTLQFFKDDKTGKGFREQIINGHHDHCGWKDNFSPNDFLKFPYIPPITLRIDFLRRLEHIMKALIRYCSESNSKSTEGYLPSIQLDKIRLCSPVFYDWLVKARLNESGDTFSGIIIPMTEIGQCDDGIQKFMYEIDNQIKICSKQMILDSNHNQSFLEFIDAFIERSPCDESDSGKATRSTLNNIIRVSTLLSITGWDSNSTAETKIVKKCYSNETTESNVGESAVSFLNCELCGRCFPLSTLFKDSLALTGLHPESIQQQQQQQQQGLYGAIKDPLLLHKSFCLWAKIEEDDNSTIIASDSIVESDLNVKHSVPGWECCLSAVTDRISPEWMLDTDGVQDATISNSIDSDSNKSIGNTNTRKFQRIICSDVSSGSPTKRDFENDLLEAETVYKKIKMMLDETSGHYISKLPTGC